MLLDKPSLDRFGGATGDVWSWYEQRGGGHYICYEDGTSEKLQTKHVVFERGKYEGDKLSDVLDKGYLQWLSKLDDDWFVPKMALIRLKEL